MMISPFPSINPVTTILVQYPVRIDDPTDTRQKAVGFIIAGSARISICFHRHLCHRVGRHLHCASNGVSVAKQAFHRRVILINELLQYNFVVQPSTLGRSCRRCSLQVVNY